MSTPVNYQEQLFIQERRTGIGGSDVHHLWNLEPWGCQRRLWFEKRGVPADQETPEATAAIYKRGKLLEPLVVDEFCEATGQEVRTSGIVRHAFHPYLMVHVDRVIVDNSNGPGVLEVKTVASAPFAKYRREGLPPAYILQLQHGMLVTSLKWGAFAVMNPDSWKLLHWEVPRNEDICREIESRGEEFWRLVENGPMPPALDMDTPQCRRCPYRLRCHAHEMDVKLMAEDGNDRPVWSNEPELVMLAQDYIEASELVKEAEDLKESSKLELAKRLGDRTAVEVPGAKIYYRWAKPAEIWDDAKLKRFLGPKIAEYRTTKKAARPLKVYGR